MVCDILIECNNVLYDFKNVIYNPELYLKLDDSIIDEIIQSEDPRLQNAK